MPLRADLPTWELDKLLDLAQPAAVVAESPHRRVGRLARRRSRPASTSRPTRCPIGSPSARQPGRVVRIDRPPEADRRAGRGVRGRRRAGRPAHHHRRSGHAGGARRCTTSTGSLRRAAPARGRPVVLMERFDAAPAVELIERHQVTFTVMVPTMLQRIARLPDLSAERSSRSLERLVYGGATVPDWVVDRWIELVRPERFMFAYGSSETARPVHDDRRGVGHHRGATGRPMDVDAEHPRRATAAELPAGEVGDVYFMRPRTAAPCSATSAIPTPEADRRRLLHRRRPGIGRRRRLPVHRRPPSRHDHHRRRQRVPGRGRDGAERAPRRRSTRWSSASPTPSGATGSTPSCSPSTPAIPDRRRAPRASARSDSRRTRSRRRSRSCRAASHRGRQDQPDPARRGTPIDLRSRTATRRAVGRRVWSAELVMRFRRG